MRNIVNSTIGIFIVFTIFFPLSPFVFSSGNAGALTTICSIIIIFLLLQQKINVTNNLYMLLFPVLLSFIISALYWQEIMLLNYPKYLIFSIIIVSLLQKNIVYIIGKYSTFVIVFALCCAVIGFIYAAIGGSAIYTITNPNGREFYFYLTTFTVTNYSGFIRPSAFFDEPGALSFYICFVVMLREILWPRKKALNFALLAFGIVTLSLAHIVFTILYIIYCLITKPTTKLIVGLVIILILSFVFLAVLPNKDVVFEYLISRSSSDTDGQGRSALLQAAIDTLQNAGVGLYIFGIDSNCLVNYDEACRYIYPRMGENILSPVVFGGLLTSWLFYFSYIYVGYKSLRKFIPNFIIFSFLLLYLQRPYIYLLSYSFMFMIALRLSIGFFDKEK